MAVAIGNKFRPSDYLMNLLRRNASKAGSCGVQSVRDLPLEGIPYFPMRLFSLKSPLAL